MCFSGRFLHGQDIFKGISVCSSYDSSILSFKVIRVSFMIIEFLFPVRQLYTCLPSIHGVALGPGPSQRSLDAEATLLTGDFIFLRSHH